jgi:hypothetical protein
MKPIVFWTPRTRDDIAGKLGVARGGDPRRAVEKVLGQKAREKDEGEPRGPRGASDSRPEHDLDHDEHLRRAADKLVLDMVVERGEGLEPHERRVVIVSVDPGVRNAGDDLAQCGAHDPGVQRGSRDLRGDVGLPRDTARGPARGQGLKVVRKGHHEPRDLAPEPLRGSGAGGIGPRGWEQGKHLADGAVPRGSDRDRRVVQAETQQTQRTRCHWGVIAFSTRRR